MTLLIHPTVDRETPSFAAQAGIAASPGCRILLAIPPGFRIFAVSRRHLRWQSLLHPMIRKAFVMSVHAGCEEEYEHRHRPIWAELEMTLREYGVHNYSIFLHPGTRQLFGYVEIEDEARWTSIAETAVCKKWWAHMRDMMPSEPDNRPVSTELRELFHLD